ncbi:Serpentine receptor class r-10 [Caenorhabditis elegans]|uniref:Serpentine receptor class r-10 n=1 Tax=Caenorhabditis elegans TaxID=6239 RepID=O18046_CAEEL|nr:Seven TM Receptor [Caenorhabditis elegans]CAB03307.1 Seven TM Receptor [Caenorhabditis elegans]|eukprot:NP_506973.1 Uncharacterized protein CELE_T06C12.11 [Caenorhabditis elegans]
MYLLVHTIQYFGFFFSQFTNLVLLYLLWAKAGKQIGPFRYLMMSFSLYSVVYNYVDIVTHPLVLMEKQVCVVVNHGPFRYTPGFGYVLICIFGASFGLCISILCTQYMFRYIVICQQKHLHLIEGKRLALLFLYPFAISITWFSVCYFGLKITPEKRKALKITLQENYDEDSDVIMFAAAQYWILDDNGETTWCLRDCLAALGMVGLMVERICCFVVSFCGIKTFRKMMEVQASMSRQTVALNKTLLPSILMYGPVGLLFFAPLFEWNLQLLVSSAGATTAIYPAFEPLIVIFCISLFRRATFPCKQTNIITSSAALPSII